ncbi:hypothetical protein ACQZ6J_24730 [Rhizobium sp. A37_96]
MRFAELLLLPFRTALVIAPLWLVYWMYARFSLSDVSILYDAAIWFSVALAVLSIAKTALSMRVAPTSLLLRDAGRTVRFFAILRRPEFWTNLVEAIRVTRAADAPGALSRSELRVLRRIELFLLTPLRVAGLLIVYPVVRDVLPVITPIGFSWLGTINGWMWFGVMLSYLFYVSGRAVAAIVSMDDGPFDDARRLRDWVRRLRR